MGKLWDWLERLVSGRDDASEAVSSATPAAGPDTSAAPEVGASRPPTAARKPEGGPERDIADFLVENGYASAEQIENAERTQSDGAPGHGLCDYMAEKGYASREQIEDARDVQRSTRCDLVTALIALGLNPRDVYESMAQELQVPFVDLTVYKPDQSALNMVPYDIVVRHNVLPIKKDGATLYVAMADLNNITANDDIRLVSRCVVRGVLAVPEHIEDSISRLYGGTTVEGTGSKGGMNPMKGAASDAVGDSDMKTTMARAMAEYGAKNNWQIDEDETETGALEDAPIVRLANTIIQQAVKVRASDIHIEPDRRGMRIRYRTDGVLHEVMQMPRFIQAPLLGRYAVMADFNLATHRGKPQRGVIGIKYQDVMYQIHVSASPTLYGDKLMLKIVDTSVVMRGWNELGFTPEVQAKLEELARQPSGLLLFAGPRGSGRSTTQYSLLNKLNSIERSLLTIEPTSSYQLGGIAQVDLRQRRGLTYRDVWSAAQDVDVLHIERIANAETADLAVSSAEAGVLVLAAIDAPDAISGLQRLTELRISADRAGRAVRGILAQYLARRICADCKEFYEIDAVELRRFGFRPVNSSQKVQLARGAGCEQCRQTGYKGRLGVYELLVVNAEIVDLLARCGSSERLREAARANGMHPLAEDSLVKILEGQTTPEEVMRILSF